MLKPVITTLLLASLTACATATMSRAMWRSPSRTRFSLNATGRERCARNSVAPPPESTMREGAAPCAAIAAAMRSMAPTQAWIEPVVIASGVLAGNGRNSPSVSRSAAVPPSSARRISAGPGTMSPPRKRPSMVSASMVSAVPALTTSWFTADIACAPMRLAQRSVPSCEASR